MEHLRNWEQKPSQSGKENEQDLVEKEFFPNNLTIDIVRHGEAKYLQKEVGLEEADDLTEAGKKEIRRSAQKLADLIKPDEKVVIWSSPFGRTLHSAQIIAEVFKERGIILRQRQEENVSEYLAEPAIKIFKTFGEVRNFSWSIFAPLVEGGEVLIDDEKFFIDKNETNPDNLDYRSYYISDSMIKIPSSVKEKWPSKYRKLVEDIEDFSSVTKRIIHPLQHLKKLKDKSYRVIIVTHDALTGFLVNTYSAGQIKGLEPGEFINLERKDHNLEIIKIDEQPLSEGNEKSKDNSEK